MFENLSNRLEGIVKRVRGKGRLTEADVDEMLREIRTALLEADVNVGVTRDVVARIREQAIGATRSQVLDPGQQIVKIVNGELTRILGGETLKITYASRPPTVVLMAGLQGSGKTTNAAKLARWFKAQGRNPLLVGADLQRPGRRRAAAHARPGASTCRCSPSPAIPSPRRRGVSPRLVDWAATCSSSTPPAASPSTRR